jgi:hypothetical protein
MLFRVPLQLRKVCTDSYFFSERRGQRTEQRHGTPLAAQIQLGAVEVRHDL